MDPRRESEVLLIGLVCCRGGVEFRGVRVVWEYAMALSSYAPHDVEACVDGFQYGWFVVFHDGVLLCCGSIFRLRRMRRSTRWLRSLVARYVGRKCQLGTTGWPRLLRDSSQSSMSI